MDTRDPKIVAEMITKTTAGHWIIIASESQRGGNRQRKIEARGDGAAYRVTSRRSARDEWITEYEGPSKTDAAMAYADA